MEKKGFNIFCTYCIDIWNNPLIGPQCIVINQLALWIINLNR